MLLGLQRFIEILLPRDPIPAILYANEAGYELVFTYTANTNMHGGSIKLMIPSGWTVPAADVRANDAGNTQADLFPVDSTATGATADNDLIVVTKSGDNATAVTIPLSGNKWRNAGTTPAVLTITLNTVTSATPSSLYVPATGLPYREYTFRTQTKASGGNFRNLVIPTTGDNAGEDPQPTVLVGAVVNGKGTVTVTPSAVYESEKDRNIQITFEALGPMYDANTDGTGDLNGTGDIDSRIQITIPNDLGTATLNTGTGVTDVTSTAAAPQETNSGGDQYVTVSRSGTVVFASDSILITDNVVTIDITRMEKGAKVYLNYRKVDVRNTLTGTPAPGDGVRFLVSTASGSGTTDTPGYVRANPNEDTLAVANDHVRTIAGSGEITLSNDVVRENTKPTLTFTYKAATALMDATLIIAQPVTTTTPPWVNRTLQSSDSRIDNYVSISGGGNAVLDLTGDNTEVEAGDPITVTGIDLGVGSSVTVRISRTMLTGRAADTTVTPAITALDAIAVGTYDWGSTVRLDSQTTGGEGLADPKLYVVGDDRARVTLGIITIPDPDTAVPADATPNTLTNYHAASKQNIRFQFVPTTPIKDGYVQVTIPSGNGWAAPSLTDVAGMATVKLVGHDGTNATLTTPAADANMTLQIVGGRTIRVNIDAHATGNIVVQYGIGDGDFQGEVQHNAAANVDIQGRFKTGTSGDHPVMNPVSVRILNVASSSGTARIATPPNSEVEAGSDDNTIRIVYTADGTMDGGRVRLHTPDSLG